MGRPSAFRPEFCEQAEKACRAFAATDKQLAEFFGVSEQTINTWKQKHPEFLEALNAGKKDPDEAVTASLFERAVGFSAPDTHFSNYQGKVTATEYTKHYPPDTVACIFWLKNRRPDLWRDRQELTGRDGSPLIQPVINVRVGSESDAPPETG